MEEFIIMNNKEIGRFKIMQGLHNKTLKQKEAGLELSLSIRQIKRLYKRYKKNGIKGLISKKRGNPSNNQLSQQIKEKTLMLIKKNYIDFGPTFAHEKLIEKHKLSISVTSVRNLMICNHIWQSKKLKKRRVFQLRERRHSIGDLIQIDGSIHDWFEGRAPKCTLLSYIDDATGKIMELKFVHAETVWNYCRRFFKMSPFLL